VIHTRDNRCCTIAEHHQLPGHPRQTCMHASTQVLDVSTPAQLPTHIAQLLRGARACNTRLHCIDTHLVTVLHD
jgi:hypothetical protein